MKKKVIVRAQSVRDKEIVVRAQSVRDKDIVIRAQSVRDKECKTQVKRQGIDICMWKDKPRSKDRHKTRKTSRMKLDVTQVFSIVDTEFEQKSNNQNDQLYRSESGEITWWKEQVRTNVNYGVND